MKIYHQFWDPLPGRYEEFKKRLHLAFPLIFDTKHICFNTKKKMSYHDTKLEGALSSSNLNDLYVVLGKIRTFTGTF